MKVWPRGYARERGAPPIHGKSIFLPWEKTRRPSPDIEVKLDDVGLYLFKSSDPAAMIGVCDQATGSNRSFYAHYRAVGGGNGHFDFPTSGQHDWSSWAPQLAMMSGELVATIQ